MEGRGGLFQLELKGSLVSNHSCDLLTRTDPLLALEEITEGGVC